MKPIYGKKRYLVLVLVSVFIVVAALTPFLLSSPSVLQYFLTSVNKKIPGRLSIDSWLIGWQQGVLCRNVVYSAPEKGITVSIPSLASNRGLLELMLAPKNLGTVHVDSPLVELSRRSIQEFIASGKTTAAETDKDSGAAGGEAPVWDQVVMKLKARGGQVRSIWDDQDVTIALTHVSVDSTLAAGIASYDIGFRAMEQGFVEAVGTLNLPVHERGWFETIIVDAAVKVSSLPLEDVLRTGGALASLPQGKGVMQADLQIKTTGLDYIEFSGLAELSDVSLHGGFLGDDQPSFRQFRLAVEQGRWTGSEWSFKELELVSDTLNMKVSSETAPGKMQLSGQGTINLPVLFDQIPRLLKVNESVFVETGFLDFTVDMERSPNPSIKFKAKADTIGGIFEDQRFSWDSPVSLLFNGEKNGAELRVSALQFDAPFARVKGSGDLHSFVLDGEMEIDRAFADMGMLFQVDWSGGGSMALLVKSGPAENDDNRLQIDAALDIDDFILHRHDKPVAPLHTFSLNGGLGIPNTFFDHGTGELDLQVVLSSWLGEFFLVMNGERSGDRPFRPYYTTDVEIDLDQLSTLLATSAVFDKWPVIGGVMQLQAAGFTGETEVEIRDLSAEATDFSVQANGTVFAEPRIHLQVMQPVNEEVPFLSVRELEVAADKDRFFRYGAGRNMVDFSEGKIILHNVRLQAESVSASVDRLVVPDWREPFQGMDSQFSLSHKSAGMNEGGFAFVVGTDPAADTAVVKTSDSSQTLTGLKLSDPLVALLLSRAHPLFGGLAQPAGLVDVRLDSLWWPMGEGNRDEADFVVIFDVREIHLECKNQLKDLLALFGLEKETLQLRDNKLYCIGKQGRVKCSPVRVLAGDAEIVLSGFVGMDGSLAYEIDVPVSGKIKGAAGAGVKVAIKGTTGEPTFDKEAVESKIQGLAEQAANETINKNNGT